MKILNTARITYIISMTLVLGTKVIAADLITAGDSYGLDKNEEAANVCYDAAMMENPRLSLKLDFLLRRSRIGREIGAEEFARAQLERAKNLAVSEQEIGQTSWLLGLDAFFVGDYNTAQTFFAEALLSHPDPPLELLYYLGWALYENHDFYKSRNAFLNLLDLNQGEFDSQEIYVILASIEIKQAHFSAALELISKAIGSHEEKWYTNEALYIAGYASFRLDSLPLANQYFSGITDSTLRNLSLARIALEEGRFDLARELYTSVEGQAAIYGKALALYLAGNSSRAQSAANEYLVLYPEGENTALIYLLLSSIQRERRNYTKAVELLDLGLKTDSLPNPDLLYALAMTQFERGKYREAITATQQLTTFYPLHPRREIVKLLKARSFFHLGETEPAQALLQQLLQESTSVIITDQAHFYLGEIAASLGDYEKATDQFSKVTEGSLYYTASKRRGEVLSKQGRHREAIEAFRVALEHTATENDREVILLLIEENRLAIGIYSDRIAMLKEFIEQYPDASRASELQLEIALEYFEKGNNISALHELNKLLVRYPASDAAPEALQYKARTQLRLAKIKEAIITYRQIPALYPKSSVVQRSQTELAELLTALGQESEALATYAELLSKSHSARDRAIYTLSMAEIFFLQKNYQTAADMVVSALDESSASSVTKKGYLLGAKVELARGDLEAADRYAKRYKNTFGETAEYLLTKGSVDKTWGRIKEALAAYRKAASRFPHGSSLRIESLINAADCAEILGRIDDARSLLEEAALEVEKDQQRVEITRKLQRLG